MSIFLVFFTMLLSLALILFFGLIFGKIFATAFKLPSLIGMIVCGVIIGPSVLNILDAKTLLISPELRQIALIIILAKAGLNLEFSQLKKASKLAILMCFIPACLEIAGTIILAPIFFGISYIEAALLGSVIAAVSPAIIVPRMIKLINEGYGKKKAIAETILLSSSVDDVFVIVLFYVFLGIIQTNNINAFSFFNIPLAIVMGVIVGIIIGYIIYLLFSKCKIRDTVKVLLILIVSFFLISGEKFLSEYIAFSSLLSIMTITTLLAFKSKDIAQKISLKFSKLWFVFEIFLFVLVGASVDIQYAKNAGITGVLFILSVCLFRVLGVIICCINSKLNAKEILFCAIAYIPKATVQAAIGGIALTMNFACGELILTISVISILITAPIGAFLIEKLYKKCLQLN